MRPTGAILMMTMMMMLMMMMFMWGSAEGIADMCKKNPPVPCKYQVSGGGEWYQLGDNRCTRAFFYETHLNFDDAEKTCQKYKIGGFNGHLVSIHSQAQLNEVLCAMYKVHPGKPHYWIGLRFMNDPYYIDFFFYGWTDGTEYAYRNFANGQPDKFLLREECIEMNYWSWGLWNDERCWANRPYMCAVRYR
ncbi:C-type isolectin Sp-CL4-like [Trachinotus anak]|uniref:C-type isolectin Sp-CL4-like n=1 Tax=Trachinotus anak TaxID=443729 RepID=UPI0039F1EC91